MSAAELVTISVDDREVQVAQGLGLVEAALAGGIEIPVFCYEPRLGAPTGACRMCLVEVEGMPKLQAGCTLTAQDGMVVRTAQSSEKAADGQEANLELMLVNHPLDCPVCDKGGECPLQDLTFKYGPGATRMTFDKRTFDKPIPISPHIALDRERCILCYRCTRFSDSVAEDGELVAINRGAQSMIATFEDEPYRGRFSGNVIELCPVGALTSTHYRFLARPWEIQNVPSVCGMCPVGCNISATTREGKLRRILSRNHPEVDEGWLCDKGRFAYSHLYARDRIVDPLRRTRRRGFSAISWDEALDEAERLLRSAGSHTLVALSGSETVEQAYALARLLRVGLGAHAALLPEDTDVDLDAFRAPLSEIGNAKLVLVVGDIPVEERAPIVDLWIRAARRAGAEVRHGTPDKASLEDANSTALVGSGVTASDFADLAHRLGVARAYWLPETANGRGVADAWAAAADAELADPAPVKLLVVSGDEAAANPDVRALAEQAESVIAITMFQGLAVGWADLVLPGTSYLERDGTYVNLEGRIQRLRRAVIPPAPDELAWISKLAERFGVSVSAYPAKVFEEVSAIVYGGRPFGAVGERAELPEPVERAATERPRRERKAKSKGIRLVTFRPLFSGPAVERIPELAFQRPEPKISLSPTDAKRIGVAEGDDVVVRSNGTSASLRANLDRRLRSGVVRIAQEHARDLGPIVEVTKP
jgi:NADH dehydrogenase/NADH:ubiquinone oxidoreductase subunit G